MAGPGRVKHVGRGDLVLGELWTKMIMNCAWNALSALTRSAYGRLGRSPLGRDLILAVMMEAVAVAQAAGVRLPEADLPAAVLRLRETMAEATSSTAQDIARRKPTEIDSLNGYLARRGAELGVPTPLNAALFSLVKLLEGAA